jgi:hypothetical protein
MTLMALFYSSFVSAEVYKWVDAKGETHFSDKPPKSARSNVTKRSQPAARKPKLAKLKSQQRNRKPKPAKRKVYRKKVAARKTKPRLKRVTRSKRVVRSAKITQGKKTRQLSVSVPKRKMKAMSQFQRETTPVLEERPVTTQTATMLLSSLNATFYDLEKVAEPTLEPTPKTTPETKLPHAKAMSNFKQSLCLNHRRNLAVLQEKGFEYYYDDKGELRVAWGVEGFYRQKKRYLSASDAAKKIKVISSEIGRYCDNPMDKTLQVKARQDWIRSEYCDVSKVILADLDHPFMRTPESEIKAQKKEVERFCVDYPANKYRDDERYYPTSLQVERLQQQHFLYR